jgi:hypothetical protein
MAIHTLYLLVECCTHFPTQNTKPNMKEKDVETIHGVASWPNIRPHKSKGADFQSVWSLKSSAELKQNFFKGRKCAEFCKRYLKYTVLCFLHLFLKKSLVVIN